MKVTEPSKYNTLAYFILLFLFGFLIRLFFLNHSIGSDEALTLMYYILPKSSPLEILITPYRLNVHPLAAFNVSVMKYYFSNALPILRLPNFIIGLIAFPFLYFFTKKHFGHKEALFVIFILIFSLPHIRFSTETQGYSGMITFSLLLLIVTMKLAQKGNIWLWFSFIILLIINSYNHLASLFLFAVVGAFLIIIFLKDYYEKKRSSGRTSIQLIILFTGLCIAMAVVNFAYNYQGFSLGNIIWSKMVDTNLERNHMLNIKGHTRWLLMLSTQSNLSLGFFYTLFTEFAAGERISSLIQFVLFITGIYVAWRKNFQPALLLSLLIVSFLFAGIFRVNFAPNHYSFLLIPFWIFMAVGGIFLFECAKKIVNPVRKFGWGFLSNGVKENYYKYSFYTGCIVLFVWSYVPFNVWLGPNLPAEIFGRLTTYQDTRGAAAYIKKSLKERDIILNISKIAIPPDGGSARYYFKEYYEDYALENIFSRGKGVRAWYIGNLEKGRPLPHTLPDNFNPKEVARVYGYKIYLDDNLTIWADSISEDIKNSSPFWIFLKGWHLGRIGNYLGAIIYYDQFVRIPNIKNIRRGYNNLALMRVNIGRIDLAVDNLKKALSADPALDSGYKANPREYTAPLFNLGVLLCAQAMKDDSITDKLKYKEGMKLLKEGMQFWNKHTNQDMFIKALNGKIVDFRKATLIVNTMINHKMF